MSLNSLTNLALSRRPDFAPLGGPPANRDALAQAVSRAEVIPQEDAPHPFNPAATPIMDGAAVAAAFIPTEVLTLYVAVTGVAQQIPVPHSTPLSSSITEVPTWLFGVFLALTPTVTWLMFARKLKAANKPLPLRPALWPVWEMSAGTVAFAIWAISLPKNPFADQPWNRFSPIALLLISAILGWIAPFFQRPLPK